MRHRTTRSARATKVACLIALASLVACSGIDEGEGSPSSSTAANAETTAPPASDDSTTSSAGTDTPDPSADPYVVFPTLDAPTGEPMVVGLVNTEGVPGLDFPDIREAMQGAVDYLGQHGGFGDRPIQLETCITKASPESSQQCAQELVGKGVELVLLGLDVFPDYATYTAAGVPVIGVLPILPGDYSADALFLTGGNATVGGAMAAVAKDHFGAKTVGIVSADNLARWRHDVVMVPLALQRRGRATRRRR